MNLNDIKREVIRLAKADPDFVYEPPIPMTECTYTRVIDNEIVGDCIFGQALINLGFDKNILAQADKALSEEKGSSISTVLIENDIAKGFDDDISVYEFDSVQMYQDMGIKWIEAIKPLLED